MSYRQIHSRLWKDTWFIELDADLKLLFIYLFSNELAMVSGIYQIPLRVIAFEVGLPVERVEEGLARFHEDGKVFYDPDRSLIWVKNLRKYNATSSPKVRERIRKDLEAIPDCPLKKQYLAYYGHKDSLTEGMRDSEYGIDTVSIPYRRGKCEQEQEQEQEKEQEHILKGADAPSASPPSATPTFQELRQELLQAKNKSATLHEIARSLFPEAELSSDVRLAGALAKKVGGWGRALEILWGMAARPPTGEVFRYALGVASRRSRDSPGDGDTCEHSIATPPYPGATIEV